MPDGVVDDAAGPLTNRYRDAHLRGATLRQYPSLAICHRELHFDYERPVDSETRTRYVDRMATIGWTDAARRAGARHETTAVSIAIAPPAT